MGRKTWMAIPQEYRPLKSRINVILTSDPSQLRIESSSDAEVMTAESLDNALSMLKQRSDVEQIFVIGGARSFNEALTHAETTDVWLTVVNKEFECDRFIDLTLLDNWRLDSISETQSEVSKPSGETLEFVFKHYVRC